MDVWFCLTNFDVFLKTYLRYGWLSDNNVECIVTVTADRWK